MFRKLLKRLTGAAFLVALALPVVAQQFTASREGTQQAAPKKVDFKTKYLVAFGKPLARTDKNGTTKYNYQNGRLVSEIQPNGVIGTYQYDSAKFTGIAYTGGRYITVAYNPNDTLSGLTTNTGARVKFSATTKKQTRLGGFLAIQNGIAALRNTSMSNQCINSEVPGECTVVIQATPEPEDDPDNGWGSGGGWGSDPAPMSGGGEGGGSGSWITPKDTTQL